MVFAVAALFLQFHAAQPATVNISTWTTAEGTKPTPAKTDTTKTSSAPVADHESKDTDTALTQLNLENVSLNGTKSITSSANDGNPSLPRLTAISLTDPQKQGLSTVRIPDDSTVRPLPVPAVNSYPSRRNWLMLALFEHGAAAFDAYSTRQAIGRGAVEEDPMMRPFAHSPAIYAAIQVGPLLADLFARKMQRSENPLLRKVWWMPQTLSGAAFLSSGVHNLGVQGRP